MSKDHVLIRCEDCRHHGKCWKETRFKSYHVRGCVVGVDDLRMIAAEDDDFLPLKKSEKIK